VGRRDYYGYVMINRSDTLYTGMTNDLSRRVYEHRQHLVDGFTKKYRIGTLVYYETTSSVELPSEGRSRLRAGADQRR